MVYNVAGCIPGIWKWSAFMLRTNRSFNQRICTTNNTSTKSRGDNNDTDHKEIVCTIRSHSTDNDPKHVCVRLSPKLFSRRFRHHQMLSSSAIGSPGLWFKIGTNYHSLRKKKVTYLTRTRTLQSRVDRSFQSF
jgi:hypothetical protein